MNKQCFTADFLHANRVAMKGFDAWVFHSGMLFGSPDKWWGNLGRRDFPHEGLDFAMYQDTNGRIQYLDHQTQIPAIFTGTIKSVFADYLGRAIVVEHADRDPDGTCFLSIYAHTEPRAGIGPGTIINAGEIIGSIADTSHSKAAILPHLHYSLGLTVSGEIDERFIWNDMRHPERVSLLDPLIILDGNHRISSFPLKKPPFGNQTAPGAEK